MQLQNNIIVDTDAYNLTDWKTLPPGITQLRAYGEARKGAHYAATCFFGLQMILIDHLAGQVVTKEKLEEAADLIPSWMGQTNYYHRAMWEHILNKHGGILPLEIKAVSEGSVVPVGNVLFQTVGLDPLVAPLTNHIETLLMHIWSTSTIATNSLAIMNDIKPLVEVSGSLELLPWMVHDFGYRGVDNHMSAARKGAAHFVAGFSGSDTLVADRAVRFYYDSPGVLKTVWATKHSVGTSFGSGAGEKAYLLHQLKNAPADATISIVIDSYDPIGFMHNAVSDPEIMSLIKARPGRTVFRPDSGNPEHQVGVLLDILGGLFHYEYNSKQYKVLKYNVGLLWGDGMDRESIFSLYSGIVYNGWSPDNLVVGSGGGLLVKGFTRDTQRFAIKSCEIELDGVLKPVNKVTSSDPTKGSKAGELKLMRTMDPPQYSTLSRKYSGPDPNFDAYIDDMQIVFKNGEVTRQSFDDIRARANAYNGEAFKRQGSSTEVRA